MKKENKPSATPVAFKIARCEVGKIYKGNSWVYGTCRVDVAEDRYDLVRVAFAKDEGVEEGDVLSIVGHVRAFYNSDKKVTEYTFYADDVKEVKT